MNNSDYNGFVADVEQHYHTSTGKNFATVGFDPTIILSIITMLLQFCPKPPAALKVSAQNPDIGTVMAARASTRVALREKYPGQIFVYARYNGDAIADAVLKSVAGSDETKIQAVQNTVLGA